MTIKAIIFRLCLALQFLAFFGLIAAGIYQSDAFNPRLLLPITLLGVSCGINTWALLERPGGTREGDSPYGKLPVRRSIASRPTPSRNTRNDR